MGIENNQNFYLMHKDEISAVLDIDTATGFVNQVGNKVVPELLPLGGHMSKDELIKWWNRRAIPNTRKGVSAALQILKLQSVGSLLVSNLALSLTDHYWIKPCDSELSWQNVNLYENSFCDTIGEFLFSNREEEFHLDGKTIFSPSASLQGELKKKWIIDDKDDRYLVKGNYGASCQQSLNEVLATEVHRMQGIVPYTKYSLTTLDTSTGKSIGCISKNYTSNKIEFIPAIDINSSEKKNNDMSDFEFFIHICCKHGLKEADVRKFMDYQIMSDYAITNTDRHFNNFGVLRNSETLKFVSLAPIYDSGNSMFWDVENLLNYDYLNISASSFRKKEVQLLNYVTDKQVLNLSKLPSEDFVLQLFEKDINMTATRRESIILAYQNKCNLLEQFQQGKSLNELAYKNRIRRHIK